MISKLEYEHFKKRRNRLTLFWFCLLVFNGILQLDSVERWFDQSQEERRVVVAQMECSNLSRVSIPDREKQSIAKLSFGLGILNPLQIDLFVSNQIGFSKANLKCLSYRKHRTIDLQQWPDFSQVSGLSPPQFS